MQPTLQFPTVTQAQNLSFVSALSDELKTQTQDRVQKLLLKQLRKGSGSEFDMPVLKKRKKAVAHTFNVTVHGGSVAFGSGMNIASSPSSRSMISSSACPLATASSSKERALDYKALLCYEMMPELLA